MKALLQQIQQSATPLHLALIVGAGNGKDLPAWRQLGANRLVLTEAHPRQAEELARRLRPEASEILISQAVVGLPQDNAILYPLNNLAYSSLTPPTALLNHYPNLRSGETMAIPASSLDELIEAQAMESETTDLLLIDAPGQALQLLQGTPTASLQRFTWLLICCSSEPLYEGDSSASELTNWLNQIGFDNLAEDPDAIYPQSTLLFRRNAESVQRYQLRRQIDELQTQLAAQSQEYGRQLTALQQPLEQLSQEKNDLTAALDNLTHEKAELTKARDEQAKLATERQQQLDTLAQEKIELATARDALTREKTELTKARDEQTKLAGERQQQLDALAQEKTELAAARDTLTREKTELTKARDEQAKLAAERQQQLDALAQEKTELAAARDTLAREKTELTKARDEQTKQLNELTSRLKSLETETTENLHRQQLLQEELVKAEAQIELIKDLLLREPGL